MLREQLGDPFPIILQQQLEETLVKAGELVVTCFAQQYGPIHSLRFRLLFSQVLVHVETVRKGDTVVSGPLLPQADHSISKFLFRCRQIVQLGTVL